MKLHDYIEKKHICLAKFLREMGWNYTTFKRIRDGGDIRLSQVLKVQELTDGLVTIADFVANLKAKDKTEQANQT